MPWGEAVSTALAKTSRLRRMAFRMSRVESDGRLRMLSLPSLRKRVWRVKPERMASPMRCSPSMPRRSPGCDAAPLKEARRALTRALDLLVMGADGGIVACGLRRDSVYSLSRSGLVGRAGRGLMG